MRNFGYFEGDQIGTIRDFGLWRRMVKYASRFSFHITGAVLLSLLITAATLALPKLMQLGIDNYITAEVLPAAERIRGLGIVALEYGGIVVLLFIASFSQVVVLEWTGQSVMHSIRMDLFDNLLELDLGFFNKQPTGRLVTRLTNDITNMHEMFTSVMVTIFNDFLKLGGILILLFSINSKLALIMTIFVPLSVWITIIFSRLARDRFRAIRSQLAKLNGFLQEAISGMDVIQLFNRETTSLESFDNLSQEYMRRAFSQIRVFGTFMPLVELMSLTAIALILYNGGGQVITSRLTLGELVAFLAYMRLFFQPVRELSQKYSIVQSALASAERIFQLLDKRSKISAPRSPVSFDSIQGHIQYEHVDFYYEQDKKTLDDICLEIAPRETIAFVGPTGSGKTTMINLLLRFYDPAGGRVLLDGTDIRQYAPHDLLHSISIIMQDMVFIPGTVLDNIVLNSGKGRNEVREILSRTGIASFVERFPEGLDTGLSGHSVALSAGEKQLLSIARALCRDTPILVLDEATAFVDTETESILEHALTEIFSNRTALIIAHRLTTVQQADRIVVLKNGRIVEQGSHNELMRARKNYYRLVSIDQHFDKSKE